MRISTWAGGRRAAKDCIQADSISSASRNWKPAACQDQYTVQPCQDDHGYSNSQVSMIHSQDSRSILSAHCSTRGERHSGDRGITDLCKRRLHDEVRLQPHCGPMPAVQQDHSPWQPNLHCSGIHQAASLELYPDRPHMPRRCMT